MEINSGLTLSHTLSSACVNLAVGTTFLSVMERMGGSAGFFLYGLLAVAGLWYVGLCVPETGGRTPEEVMELMKVSDAAASRAGVVLFRRPTCLP